MSEQSTRSQECPVCLEMCLWSSPSAEETEVDKDEEVEETKSEVDEDTEVVFRLPCDHLIHKDCCEGLTSFACPLCRVDMRSALPDDLVKTISDQAAERMEEINGDLGDYATENESVRARTFREVRDACMIIRRFGGEVPLSVNFTDPNREYEPNYVFRKIVGESFRRKNETVNN